MSRIKIEMTDNAEMDLTDKIQEVKEPAEDDEFVAKEESEDNDEGETGTRTCVPATYIGDT